MVAHLRHEDHAVMRLTALPVVLLPMLLVGVGTAFAEDPPGVEARDMVWAEPVDFPPDTVMFVASGCYHCDGGDSAIYRVSRAGAGPTRMERVLPPAGAAGWVSGFAVSDDGGLVFASLFDWEECPYCGDNWGSTSFFASTDGGVSWRLAGRREHPRYFFGLASPFEAVAVAEGSMIYLERVPYAKPIYRYTHGRILTPEEVQHLVINRHPRRYEWDKTTQTVSKAGGAVVATVPMYAEEVPLDFRHGSMTVLVKEGRPPLLHWRASTSLSEYLTAIDNGVLRGFRFEGLLPATIHWLDDRLLAGTFAVAPQGCTACQYHVTRPTLVDFESGIAYPIADLLDTTGSRGSLGRTAIRNAARGPFMRVATTECLPVGAWADRFASQVACVAPGVLLRPTGGVRYEDGLEWREVRLPDGTPGWAPRNALEG
jgi:hypothetical protein